MLIKWWKQQHCHHQWIKKLEREEMNFINNMVEIETESRSVVYAMCLQCKKRKKFSSKDWEVIQAYQS